MAMPGEKNISAFVAPDIAEQFKRQCEERKYFKGVALEGALRAWLLIDRNTQRDWIEGKPKPESNPEDLDDQIRQLARDFVVLSEKLEYRAATNAKKADRKRGKTA